MTITVDIRPEVQAELARRAAVHGRAIETEAASLLEEAVNPIPVRQPAAVSAEPTQPEHRTGQSLIDAFAEIRGLLTDEEIDRMFARNPSGARPVDLS
jgi:plasmid stability protein